MGATTEEVMDALRRRISVRRQEEAVVMDPNAPGGSMGPISGAAMRAGDRRVARSVRRPFEHRTGFDEALTNLLNLVPIDPPAPPGKSSRGLGDVTTTETARTGARVAAELGADITATIATGGAALPLRAAAVGGANALASLGAQTFDPTETPLTDAGVAGGFAVGGEGTGSVINAARRGGFLGKSFIPGGREAFESVAAEGGVVTPGLVTDSMMDTIENITSKSFTGQGRIRRARERSVEITQNLVGNMVDEFVNKGSRSELGQLVQEAVSNSATMFKTQGEVLYKRVDSLAQGQGVAIAGMKREAKAIMEKEILDGSPQAGTVLVRILKEPDIVSFQRAQQLRTFLLGVGRSNTDLAASKAEQFGKKFGADMTQRMDVAARDLGSDALQAWNDARAFWKHGAAVYNDTVIKNLARQSPDTVYSVLIRNQKPDRIRHVREMILGLKDPIRSSRTQQRRSANELWQGIQSEAMRDFLTRAGAEGDDLANLSGKRLVAVLNKFGDEPMGQLFNARQRKKIKQLAKQLEIVQSTKPSPGADPGGVLVQLTQGGAIAGLLTGTLEAASTLVLGGPILTSRLLTNPRAVEWMLFGLKEGVQKGRTDALIRATAQVAAIRASMEKRGELEQQRNIPEAVQNVPSSF